MQAWSHTLRDWHEFFAFAGTVAATLMGLMLVVVSLGQRRLSTTEGAQVMRGLHTPIVVFFATIIVVAMFFLTPFAVPMALGALLGAVSVGGLIYMMASGAHRIWKEFQLGADDLWWYVTLPYLSYVLIGVAAVGVWMGTDFGCYMAAAAMLVLLVVSIRNMWDLVVYNVGREVDPQRDES